MAYVVASSLSCVHLCHPMDCSPPGSSVHGISRGRTLEWVAIFFSPRDLSDPGIKPESPALADEFFTTEPQGKPNMKGPGDKDE